MHRFIYNAKRKSTRNVKRQAKRKKKWKLATGREFGKKPQINCAVSCLAKANKATTGYRKQWKQC